MAKTSDDVQKKIITSSIESSGDKITDGKYKKKHIV